VRKNRSNHLYTSHCKTL